MGKSALVAGATGLVGGELVEQLVADPTYELVTMLVRRAVDLRDPKLHQQVVDFDRLEEAAGACGADAVFCCLGTTIKKAGSQAAFRQVDFAYPLRLVELAKAAGAGRFLIVTAMGADARSAIFYNRVKGEVEQALIRLDLPALDIFRPSLLLGRRPEVRPGEAAGAVLMRAVAPLLAGPLKPYRAIAGADVARAMRVVAAGSTAGVHIHRSDEIAALARTNR